MPELAIISADSHSNEPEDIYDRLPAEYRARAPHEEVIDGKRYLVYDGQRPSPMEAPHPLSEDDMRRYWRDGEALGRVQHREGGTHIPTRLADQVEDGVVAEVVYPQAVFKLYASPDPGYQLALAQVYNDWHHEIFGGHPDKFVCSAQIPVIDIQDGINEAKRAGGLGYRSFSLPVSMPLVPYNMPAYEPFWANAAELGVPLAFHVFSGGPKGGTPSKEPNVATPGSDQLGQVLGMTEAMYPMVQLIAGGACARHPDLKFVLAEAGIGWIPWLAGADGRQPSPPAHVGITPARTAAERVLQAAGILHLLRRYRGDNYPGNCRGGFTDVGQRLSTRRGDLPSLAGSHCANV